MFARLPCGGVDRWHDAPPLGARQSQSGQVGGAGLQRCGVFASAGCMALVVERLRAKGMEIIGTALGRRKCTNSASSSGLYLGILLPIALLYVFTVIAPFFNPAPMPDLHAAVPVFMDLIKVIVGAAIGAFGVLVGMRPVAGQPRSAVLTRGVAAEAERVAEPAHGASD